MNKRTIVFTRMFLLRGPNIWTYQSAIEAWTDIGGLEDCPSNILPGFNDRLIRWLPSLIEHRCSIGERGGFLQRLRQGTWPAHILEHVALELQALAGMPGGFGRARETSMRGVYKVIVGCPWHEDITRAALHAGRDLVMAAIEDQPFDVAAAVCRLRDLAETLHLGPSTACIVDAAERRRIPAIRLSDANLVQLGYGARQRRIWTAETDRTSAIAEGISRDKELTRGLLQACGVPVPRGRVADTLDEAWEMAQDIGLPVVIKPLDGNHGRGVFTNLSTRDEVAMAYRVAVEEGSSVIVEQFIQGDEHRLLVVGGRMVAAARGDIAMVTGDGVHTIAGLIELQLNSSPLRGSEEAHTLNRVRVDTAVRMELARQQLAPEDVPAAGREVLIQRNGNVAIDVTDNVHADVARAVVLAARVVGLDIAGVDLVARDISRPLGEQQGAIVEVNAGPGLLMHLKPSAGQPRPVGEAIVDHLFAAGDTGYVPIVGVSGSRGKTMVARMVAHLLQLGGAHIGLACSDGMFLAQRRVLRHDCADWDSARRLLMNPAVEAAVVETGFSAMLRDGLAYDRCRVGVVTNVDPLATYPDFDILDAEQLPRLARTQVDVVQSEGVAVLNADDPACVELAPLCDGQVIFFGLHADSTVLARHRSAQGRAVFVRDGEVFLAQGMQETRLARVAAIPLANGGLHVFHLQNVLAAVAAAWGLDVPCERMRAGVETFGAPEDESMPEGARWTL
ncbi:cyanophycin synthetase [Alcaligenaceae bacterium]|nr:cyanophycin synthetase [Alcaligenaceae bacterium]